MSNGLRGEKRRRGETNCVWLDIKLRHSIHFSFLGSPGKRRCVLGMRLFVRRPLPRSIPQRRCVARRQIRCHALQPRLKSQFAVEAETEQQVARTRRCFASRSAVYGMCFAMFWHAKCAPSCLVWMKHRGFSVSFEAFRVISCRK